MADLTVDETFGDQLKDFDLASGRLLLELAERSDVQLWFRDGAGG